VLCSLALALYGCDERSVTDAAAAREDSGAPGDASAMQGGAAAPLPLRSPPYPEPVYPEENPFDAKKALLGKALFWDQQLSYDDSVACGTCHEPRAGGADGRTGFLGHPGADGVRGTPDDPRGSLGVRRCARGPDGGPVPVDDPVFGTEPQVTRRRSMSFMDAMFWTELFWDGRAGDLFADPAQPESVLIARDGALESQALLPLQDTAEMACAGFTLEDLAEKLARVVPLARASALPRDLANALREGRGYPALFADAFGSEAITAARIAFAIASYERGLRSDQTPWDLWNAGDDGALDEAALRGYVLFTGKARCSCCHGPPLFGGSGFGHPGFERESWDEGRAEVTREPHDRGKFRVPSLRNVGLREAGGLLHDGIGAGRDLPALLARYDEDPVVPSSVGLCVRRGVGLSSAERTDLLQFLRVGLTDPRAAAELPPCDRPRLGAR
jgi:cytochrome c peroxidase